MVDGSLAARVASNHCGYLASNGFGDREDNHRFEKRPDEESQMPQGPRSSAGSLDQMVSTRQTKFEVVRCEAFLGTAKDA
jgi:hypothetical protein